MFGMVRWGCCSSIVVGLLISSFCGVCLIWLLLSAVVAMAFGFCYVCLVGCRLDLTLSLRVFGGNCLVVMVG